MAGFMTDRYITEETSLYYQWSLKQVAVSTG